MDSLDWPTVDVLTRRVQTTPDRTAVIDADRGDHHTFRSFSRLVDTAAAGLQSLDVDRVGVLLETSPAFVCVLFASMRTRTTVVPLSLRETAPELESKAERADVDAFVCEASTEALATEFASGPIYSLDGSTAAEVRSFPRSAGNDPVEPATLERSWTQLVAFTSGTSGEPKAVRLTVGNLLASATASAFRLGLDRDDRWLCCLPMYHVGGLAPTIRSSLYGTTVVTQRAFDPDGTARVVEEYGITGISLVPTMLDRMLDAGWRPPEHVRFVLLGGASADADLVKRSLAAGVPVCPTYGMTETASQIATATPDQVVDRPDSVGQSLFGTDVTVLDRSGDPVGPGERGELAVSGPTVTPGYVDETRTEEAFCEHGLLTGDVGYRDADGYLWVVDRRDDRIVTGGENVDPAEVRDVLRSHQAVETAAVVALPDDQWGEQVAALVVPSDPSDPPTIPSVIAHCDERLAGFKRPRRFDVVEELPRTVSGTVDREATREHLLERGVEW